MNADGPSSTERQLRLLRWVIALNVLATVIEIFGFCQTFSLAVVVNVVMGLVDASALGLNYYGRRLEEKNGQRKAKEDRAKKIAHYSNLAIGAICLAPMISAAYRLYVNQTTGEVLPFNGTLIMLVAGLGLLCDGISLKIYPEQNGNESSPNIRSGKIKVINGVVSCGTSFITGAIIWRFGFHWLDSVAAIGVGGFILWLLWDEFRNNH
ncbi:MAG: cation transporter [Patescibacteria group bacterium]